MPMNALQSLTTNEVYAASAYLLFLNSLVPEWMPRRCRL